MPYRDLREWIEKLEKEGELVRIKEEINPEPDVGAIGRASCDIEGPGILAEKVSGFESPLAICLHGSFRRTAMAMDLPKSTTCSQQARAWLEAFDRYPVKAKMVGDAPCKENILTGERVNLFQFPIVRINADDASFYISKGMCITKALDFDWVNVGLYRMMVLNRNQIAISAQTAAQHIRQQCQKYQDAGKLMEMAVALGTEPVLPMAATTRIPAGWSEFDFAGAVRKEPEELVKAETVDLPVPARAEIVLEGIVRPDMPVLEGPFGEHPGSYSGCFWVPTYEITAITYRNNPIYDSLFIGKPLPLTESSCLSIASKLGGIWKELKPIFPQITEIAFQLPNLYNMVVQGKWGHSGEPKRVMNAIWGSLWGVPIKQVTVVDEDVDPWDARDVLWAIATRCQANTDMVMIPGSETTLDPSRERDTTDCKLGIDATKSRPPFYRHKASAWIAPREGTERWKEKILTLWQKGR